MSSSCTDSGLLIQWYSLRRALFGVGEKPNVYSEEDIKLLYNATLEGLEGFENSPRVEQCRLTAHTLYDLTTLDFEIASQLLIQKFPERLLKTMTKKDYHQLFLRYANTVPQEKILAREERQRTINRASELKIIRREWFDYRCQNRKI